MLWSPLACLRFCHEHSRSNEHDGDKEFFSRVLVLLQVVVDSLCPDPDLCGGGGGEGKMGWKGQHSFFSQTAVHDEQKRIIITIIF